MALSFNPAAPRGAVAFAEPLGTLVVTGPDRLTWLNGLVTCNLAPLRPGQGAYGLATSKVGRILADVLVVVGEDRLLVSCPRARLAPLAASLENYLVMEDAELADDGERHAWYSLHGPAAADAARAARAEQADWWVSALDRTGLGGAAMVVPRAASAEVEGRLRAVGVEIGADGDWEELRLLRGLPAFGVDFDEKTYPQEASLERRAVSFQKGCYLGQEVVCRLEMRGHVHRKLVSIVLAGAAAPPVGAELRADTGEAVGAVTSARASERLGRAVALGMVKFAFSDAGTRLSVGGAEGQVVAMPVGPRA